MLDALHSLLAPAAVERLTLLANHVMAAEPVATQRLRAHVGKRARLQLDGWPRWLPPVPVLAFRVTPAGLLEWSPEGGDEALQLSVDMARADVLAQRVLAGQRPDMTIAGDVGFAADVGWIVENLRWDLAADLERFLPASWVQQLVLAGRALRSGLQGLLAARQAGGGDEAGRGA